MAVKFLNDIVFASITEAEGIRHCVCTVSTVRLTWLCFLLCLQHDHGAEDEEEEARLQDEFKKLLKDMEAYLKPLTSQLVGLLT